MKKSVKKILFITIYAIFILFFLELSSKIIIFSYLKRNLPRERFEQIFYKSNFLFAVGAVLRRESELDHDLYELTHLKESIFDINAEGYRGKIVPISKSSNTIRILCLGDSVTFGIGVSHKQAYPYLLEKKLILKYPKKKIEVINGGVPGSVSIDGKRRFQIRFMKYEPDIVLWRTDFFLTDSLELPKINMIDHFVYWVQRKIVRSCLVNLILVPFKTIKYFNPLNKQIKVPEGVESNYDLVKLLGKQIGAQVFSIDYIYKNSGKLEVGDPDRKDRDDHIETYPLFLEAPQSPDELFYDEVHLTEIGNELLAEAVYCYLVKCNIINTITKQNT